jgi:large subunit ribosomal protein L4
MAKAPLLDASGEKSGEVELAPQVFDVQVNVPVMHEVVRAQMAAARSGTHSTKTRAEVSGGGRKPWRQKGLGRARHGSIREPQWRGGGVAHGPQPRDHSIRVNRKTRALALRSALTDRAREGKIVVIDLPSFEEPRTKEGLGLLERWGADGVVLLVVGPDFGGDGAVNTLLSFRNLPQVNVVPYPTAYSVLASDTVVITREALDLVSGGSQASRGVAEESQPGADSEPAGEKGK